MKLRYIIIFLLPILFFNCEESLDEFNTDPTRNTDVALNLALPEAIASAAYNEGGNQARVAGIVMQQFEGLDAQQLQYTTYVIQEATFNNYWRFGLYAGALKSCDVIVKKAAEEGSTFYSGVGKILMAQQYGLGTAYFGDMPFSQALQGQENLQPSYDSQQAIYSGVLAMLDDAISDLGTATGYFGGDLIYDGDAASWIKTAQGLKARFLLHLSKRDGSNYAKALTALGASYESAAEESNLTFDDTDSGNWSLAAFSTERGGTLGMDAGFVSMMAGDPRESIIMTGGAIDGFWTRNNASVPIISYTELKFIEAECLLETGGSDADVAAALAAGVGANMTTLGIGMDSTAMAYTATVSDIAGLDGAAKKDRIITEAYKAYFGYNFHETWSNWRRTGFPALTPKADGANGSNPSGGIPLRWLYASSESETNSANVEAAKSSQGGALLDVPLWVFE